MGLFILPNLEEASIEDFVQTALDSIELWKENPNCEYLLECFACNNLERAARLIRKEGDRSTEQDLEKEKDELETQKRIEENIKSRQSNS